MRSVSPARRGYVLCGALIVTALVVSALTQQSLTAERGLGFDGGQYAQMTTQCGRDTISALDPFVYRIGVPCIAATIPAPPKDALRIVNVGAGILLIVLLTIFLRRHVPDSIVPWLVTVFAWHWVAPLRYTWWYPTYVDPLSICALVAALLVSHRPLLFAMVCGAGVLIRETGMVVPLAYIAGGVAAATNVGQRLDVALIVRDTRVRAGVLGAIAGLAAIAFTHAVAAPTSDYWVLDSAIVWLYSKSVPTYVLAWFIAFGPMLVIAVIGWPAVRRLFAGHPEFAMLAAAIVVMAIIGGTDTERFLMWGAPIVLVVIGVAAASLDWRRATAPLALLIGAQIVNGRWFLTTPSVNVEGARPWPLLTPLHANRFEDLVSANPDHIAAFAACAEYMVIAAVLLLWLRQTTTQT